MAPRRGSIALRVSPRRSPMLAVGLVIITQITHRRHIIRDLQAATACIDSLILHAPWSAALLGDISWAKRHVAKKGVHQHHAKWLSCSWLRVQFCCQGGQPLPKSTRLV